MKEYSNREKISKCFEWTENHSLKIVSQDHEVQEMLNNMNIVTTYEFPPIRRSYPRSNFED